MTYSFIGTIHDPGYEVLYSGSGGSIIHHLDEETIVLTDGVNTITIADKNLGATECYHYGDTLSESNCGKYYQRGNNYGFAWSGSVTTSSTQVNASSYGPGNYYSSSTFITGNYNWDSSNNDNLRGDTTNTEAARQGPAPEGYHVPSTNELQALWSLVQAITGATNGSQLSQYCLLPFAGYRIYSNASVGNQGSYGSYWSSSPYRDYSNYASRLRFFSSDVSPQNSNYRSNGFSVRCFLNSD